MGSPTDDDSRASRRGRRARGEGSIWQDQQTGRWWYAISIDGKQYKYRAPDKQTAAARLKQLKAEHDQGVTPGAGRVTLGAHCQAWMDSIVINKKPKTQQFYRQITEHYLLPYLGAQRPVSKITAEHILDMLNGMRRAEYAAQTIDHVYTVGKTILEYARKWRKIMFNPFDAVDPPEVDVVAPTPLTEAEATALLAAVADHRLHMLYVLALILGLRKGELLGLTIDGVHLDTASIAITQQVLDLEGRPSIEPYTKSGHGTRTLPLTPYLVTLLHTRLAQIQAERETEGWAEHGLLFSSERGTPMSQRNLDRHFKGACVTAQIRPRIVSTNQADGAERATSNLRFHHLRHTCLSWLGDTGANKSIIQAVAGHAVADVTDRYVHVNLAAVREAIERMADAKLLKDA